MDNMKALVEAMNEAAGNISLKEEGVMYYEKNEKGEVVNRYFIKLRPKENEEGIEEFKYVARKQKD